MADTGWLSPTSATESGTAWSNETNIFASDNVYATHSSAAAETTPTLWAYGFDFSGVPSGATIDGIEFSIENVSSSNTSVQITRAQLFDGTTAKGSDQEAGTDVTATETTFTYGGASNLCGWTNITDADLDSTFRAGFEFTKSTTANRVISVDHVQVKIYYTASTTEWGQASISGSATMSVSGTVVEGATSGTDLTVQVSASTDDAREANAGTMQLTETTANVGQNNHVGFRFTNVTIPKDATINSAYISVKSSTTDSTATYYGIYIEDVDDATTFTSTDYSISNRTYNTALTNQTAPNGVSGQWFNSADFASALETHVSRSGWASGNDIVIQFEVTSGGRTIYTYDNASTDAAKLIVNYDSGSTGTVFIPLQLAPF